MESKSCTSCWWLILSSALPLKAFSLALTVEPEAPCCSWTQRESRPKQRHQALLQEANGRDRARRKEGEVRHTGKRKEGGGERRGGEGEEGGPERYKQTSNTSSDQAGLHLRAQSPHLLPFPFLSTPSTLGSQLSVIPWSSCPSLLSSRVICLFGKDHLTLARPMTLP